VPLHNSTRSNVDVKPNGMLRIGAIAFVNIMKYNEV
jgi:hypothetical protein